MKTKSSKLDVIKSVALLFDSETTNPFDSMMLDELKKIENSSYHYFCLMFVLLLQSQGLLEDENSSLNYIFEFLKLESPSKRDSAQTSKDGKIFVNLYDIYLLVSYYVNYITYVSINYIQPHLDSQESECLLESYSQVFNHENQDKLIEHLFFEFIHMTGLNEESSHTILESIRRFCRAHPEEQTNKSLEKFSSEGSTKSKSSTSNNSNKLIREILSEQICWVSLDYTINNVLRQLSYTKVQNFLLSEHKKNITYK